MCNFKELRNAIERTVLLSRGKIILPKHLPRRLQTSANASGKTAVETAKLSRTKYKILIGTQFLALLNSDCNCSRAIRIRRITYKHQEYKELY
ncbi:MAG: hypothetical protein JXR78_11180 [Victivallales bacterium]|nr:hypothetical protein [Victivallales bacterium]